MRYCRRYQICYYYVNRERRGRRSSGNRERRGHRSSGNRERRGHRSSGIHYFFSF
ncbi:MAG TPA: hypothetical protein PKU76_02975 [Candidatus Cloacimonas sp.]|nr:hypothetical protein [Candidatus Cloacimonas sp.]